MKHLSFENVFNMVTSSCIYFPTNDKTSLFFFYGPKVNSTVHINHIFFIGSSVDGYLIWYHNLVILKSVIICKYLSDMFGLECME